MRTVLPALVLCGGCFAQNATPKFGPKLPEHVRITEFNRGPSMVVRAAPAAATDRCAHIQVYVPPKNIDPKIVLPEGKRKDGKIKVVPPMPVCPEDVHALR